MPRTRYESNCTLHLFVEPVNGRRNLSAERRASSCSNEDFPFASLARLDQVPPLRQSPDFVVAAEGERRKGDKYCKCKSPAGVGVKRSANMFGCVRDVMGFVRIKTNDRLTDHLLCVCVRFHFLKRVFSLDMCAPRTLNRCHWLIVFLVFFILVPLSFLWLAHWAARDSPTKRAEK